MERSKNPGSKQDHHMGSVQDELNSDVPSHESFNGEQAVLVDRALKWEPGSPGSDPVIHYCMFLESHFHSLGLSFLFFNQRTWKKSDP